MGWPFRVTAPLLNTVAALVDADERLHGWEIAERAGEAPPNVYRSLARLHDAGWVKRAWERTNPEPGRPRRRMYWLTSVGRQTALALLTSRGTTQTPDRRTTHVTITIAYSHAVPKLRQSLCCEVSAAEMASAKRDKAARFRAAWAFGEALETIRRSQDASGLWVEGIMERDALPPQAVEHAAKFLGFKAADLLGLPEDDEEIVRGLLAREQQQDDRRAGLTAAQPPAISHIPPR